MKTLDQIVALASEFRSYRLLQLASYLSDKGFECDVSNLFKVSFGKIATGDAVRLAAKISAEHCVQPSLVVAAVFRHMRTHTRDGQESVSGAHSCVRNLKYILEANSATSCASADTLKYCLSMLEARYVDAYQLWDKLSGCRFESKFLDDFTAKPGADVADQKSISIVMPGMSSAGSGESIDSHALVARSVLMKPNTEDFDRVGSRTDLVFLNAPRHKRLAKEKSPAFLPPIIVTVDANKARKKKFKCSEAKDLVRYELEVGSSHLGPLQYFVVAMVKWSLENDHQPHLYHADFYLGNSVYDDAKYDVQDNLGDPHGVVSSYLAHDVFGVHYFLRSLYLRGHIVPHGALEVLLQADGAQFAEKLQNRWKAQVDESFRIHTNLN